MHQILLVKPPTLLTSNDYAVPVLSGGRTQSIGMKRRRERTGSVSFTKAVEVVSGICLGTNPDSIFKYKLRPLEISLIKLPSRQEVFVTRFSPHSFSTCTLKFQEENQLQSELSRELCFRRRFGERRRNEGHAHGQP